MRFVLHILAFSFVLAALASCSRDARSSKRVDAPLSRVESLKDRFEKVGAAVEHRDFTIDGLPADRLSVRAPGVSAEMVLVSRGSSDYMISVQWRGHAAETLDQDIERFLASFRFTAPDHRNLAN
jgi:hypothetical protein